MTNSSTSAPSHLHLSNYDYKLPESLIARYPLPERSASRLLYAPCHQPIQDKTFKELPDLLDAGDLLVFNDTKVMKARLFGKKETGGNVEVLVERLTDDITITQGNSNVALCHVRASKSPKINHMLYLAEGAMTATVIGRLNNLFVLAFESSILPDLERYGEMPIPPYFNRRAEQSDNERYQTVFHDATKQASVAAPTASLHFDDGVLKALQDKGVASAFVTLHVGAGTFAPVKTDDLTNHVMHSEFAHLPQATAELINTTKARGNKVIAVGTTVTRVLETAYLHAPNRPELMQWSGDTDIFIYPGFEFGVIDKLITNFHLPKSTLLMLVSAFAGKTHIDSVYTHAIAEKYRFFSYGDAMLLDKNHQKS